MNSQKLVAIRESTHSGKFWRPPSNYFFAKQSSLCPIDIREVKQACLITPVVFVQVETSYILCALFGLSNHSNLFVDEKGKWTTEFIPAQFRCYPFNLVPQTEDGQSVLAFDESSGLLTDSPEAHPFFNAEGMPAPTVQQIMAFLSERNTALKVTAQSVRLLAELNLLKPLELVTEASGEKQTLNGLFTIDEDQFANLAPEQLKTLQATGALLIIYCHLLSKQCFGNLRKMQLQQSAGSQDKAFSLEDTADAGSISFENL